MKATVARPGTNYRSAHLAVAAERGKASLYDCVACHKRARDWSYCGRISSALWDRVGKFYLPYSLDIYDYKPMCRPCNLKVGTRSQRGERPAPLTSPPVHEPAQAA